MSNWRKVHPGTGATGTNTFEESPQCERTELMLLRGRLHSDPPGLCHLHGPDRSGPHVHGSTIVAGQVVGFRGSEPVPFAFVDHVVYAPSGVIGLLFHGVAEHEGGQP